MKILDWLLRPYIESKLNYNFEVKESGIERSSPSDRVGDLYCFKGVCKFKLPGIYMVSVTDTNSMDPLIDVGHNAILQKMTLTESRYLSVGDVICYYYSDKYPSVMHRIKKLGADKYGRFFICQGDNNFFSDTKRIRPGDVQGVLVAVIY